MGNLRLSPLFGDRAVFPRGIPISVFGESEAEGDVLFSLPDGEERRAHFVPEGGKFSVLLDGVDRYAEEGCLTVTSAGETCVARHISVGIVLLAAGQSNMEFLLREADRPHPLYPSSRMRFYTEGASPDDTCQIHRKPASDFWYPADGETELAFSAIGYFVAEILSSTLSVTVGVVSCSQGASCIETWLSPEALRKTDFPEAELVESKRQFNLNHFLYYNKYLSVAAYPFSAVLWYQGESNTDFGRAEAYRAYLPALFAEWRANNPNHRLPFYLVELAPFDSVLAGWAPEPLGDWAPIREVLVQASLCEEGAFTVSLTEVEDVGEIHPKNKYPVAMKLARAILATLHGYDLEYTGPVFSEARVEKGALRIAFSHAEGLHLRDGAGNAADVVADAFFEGTGGARLPAARAKIEGREMILPIPEGAAAFLLGYGNVPRHNLYNGEGYLAPPFRLPLDKIEGK